MQSALTPHDSALLNQICSDVCQAIVTIQEQQPELLLEKYRSIPWNSPRQQSGLIKKLVELLGSESEWNILVSKLQQFLKALFIHEALDSQILIELVNRIYYLNPAESKTNRHLNSSLDISNNYPVGFQELKSDESTQEISESPQKQIESEQAANNSQNDSESSNYQPLANSNNKSPIAVLLLDAENIILNPETERFLETVCNFPIQVKVAFANWYRKGKLDTELHMRNYDLIHVPSGKDNADGKMIAFGSAIHERFFHAREVLVCSSDKVMTNLCNHLQQNGLMVYHVTKKGNVITINNSKTNQLTTHLMLPTLEQFLSNIKEIIREEETRANHQWVQLSKISQVFNSKYNLGLNKVLSHHLPGKTVKDIFMSKSEFVVHQIPEDNETYVTLFNAPGLNNYIPKNK
ncbi:NYN domain-containing protein [Calothrix sp. PCC 6303]|uniref:NYN domain-containing protein n=1 Tax=Calothrix sp. PCC 6303 TaxID=1170562 RepID=UPI0002A04FFB|nr:NYN domain-containing protein [Calothrix sp. PCC 6303]AFY99254.1 hypothetical protein Cal6303_0146 [Calothrix sp. PCC 6303]